MIVKSITLEEFQEAAKKENGRAPYGENHRLLKKAESTALKIEFENEKKAMSKQTALYVVRRKIVAQARIVRKANVIYLGPGEYSVLERGKK